MLSEASTFKMEKHPRIHGTLPTEEEKKGIEAMREKVKETDEFKRNEKDAARYLEDNYVMHRFLTARQYHEHKAFELLKKHLVWRFEKYRPFEMRAEEFEVHGRKGCSQVCPRGTDEHGRPVFILDDSRDNCPLKKKKEKQRSQMRFLAFNMERLLYHLEQAGEVNRIVVFITLENFKLWSAPNVATTIETIEIMTQHYPEILGHCVLYKPPWIFAKLWQAVHHVIDKKTKEKVVFVHGDTKPGSKNDVKLKGILGENWRFVCGQELPAHEEGGSPGYKHSEQWAKVLQEDKIRFSS